MDSGSLDGLCSLAVLDRNGTDILRQDLTAVNPPITFSGEFLDRRPLFASFTCPEDAAERADSNRLDRFPGLPDLRRARLVPPGSSPDSRPASSTPTTEASKSHLVEGNGIHWVDGTGSLPFYSLPPNGGERSLPVEPPADAGPSTCTDFELLTPPEDIGIIAGSTG